MSKFILRLLVVIILIAGVTTAVYFILNKPDESKKIYDLQTTTSQKGEYKDYEYLTKEIKGKTGMYIVKDGELKNEYLYTQAIKEQIEKLQYLCAYTKDIDKSEQKEVLEAIKTYNTSAYGENGVTYLAKYLYNYESSDAYSTTTVDGLKEQLVNAFKQMQRDGRTALDKLVPFVKKNVYMNTNIDEIEFFLYDLRGMISCAEIAQYDSFDSKTKVQTSKFTNYLSKLNSLINNGVSSGFNTLNSSELRKVMDAYNALDRADIVGLFRSDDTTKYFAGIKNETAKVNLQVINDYMEV